MKCSRRLYWSDDRVCAHAATLGLATYSYFCTTLVPKTVFTRRAAVERAISCASVLPAIPLRGRPCASGRIDSSFYVSRKLTPQTDIELRPFFWRGRARASRLHPARTEFGGYFRGSNQTACAAQPHTHMSAHARFAILQLPCSFPRHGPLRLPGAQAHRPVVCPLGEPVTAPV